MKPLTHLLLGILVLAAAGVLAAAPVRAADMREYEIEGGITLDDQYYNRNGDTAPAGFLSRYQYYPAEEKYNRLNIPGLDLTLHRKGEEFPAFRLQRFAPWAKNERMLLQADPAEGVKMDLDYMRYRKNMEAKSPSLTGAVGTHYTALFNDDASTEEFFVERSKTDLSLHLSSEAWGGTRMGYLDAVDLWVNNEDKDGRKFLTYILAESDVSSGGVSSRWRGRAEPFDSRLVNLGTALTLHPLSEDDMTAFVRLERENFESDDLYTVADVAALDSSVVPSNGSIDFIPDSEKDAYSMDLVDRWNPDLTSRVAVRYADLDQQSFNAGQKAAGYTGEIKVTTVVASVDYTGLQQTDLTGFYHYNQRENGSQVGVSGYKDLDSNVSDPHVAEITSRKYGADAIYRFDRLNTVFRVSGRKDQTDREFLRPSGSQAIPAGASPYTIDSDRWIYTASLYSRMLSDLTVSASFSYEDADDTALILEPDRAWTGQIRADYSLLQGRASVSAGYLEQKKENDDFTWSGSTSADQDWESRHRSVSVDGWWQIREDLNLFGAYMRDALLEDADWVESIDTRWAVFPSFSTREKGLGYQAYNDTYTLGANYRLAPKAGLLVSYLLSNSRSRIRSGTTDLGDFTKIENQYQNVNVRLNLAVSAASDLTLGYLYEDYDDEIASGGGGRNQTLSLAYAWKF